MTIPILLNAADEPPKEDRGLRTAKRLLCQAAEEPSDTEWRRGYVAALEAVLLDGYGIGCTFVPATYTFSDPPLPDAKE